MRVMSTSLLTGVIVAWAQLIWAAAVAWRLWRLWLALGLAGNALVLLVLAR